MFFKFLNSQSSYIFKISRNPENFQNLHNFFLFLTVLESRILKTKKEKFV